MTLIWGEVTSSMERNDFWWGRNDWGRNDQGAKWPDTRSLCKVNLRPFATSWQSIWPGLKS